MEPNRVRMHHFSLSVKLLSTEMDGHAHGHLVCSALQFRTGYELFVDEVLDGVKEEDIGESEEVWCQRATVLK